MKVDQLIDILEEIEKQEPGLDVTIALNIKEEVVNSADILYLGEIKENQRVVVICHDPELKSATDIII